MPATHRLPQRAHLSTITGGVAAHALPRRPRTVGATDHAAAVLRCAQRDRSVLPRWGINSPIRDHGEKPGQYRHTIGWHSRQHFLDQVIPAVIEVYREQLREAKISAGTLLEWARAKSLYAQDQRGGRRVIARPDTIASLMTVRGRQASKRLVQLCNRFARSIGLEIVITPGRMLSELESYKARREGSPQRGLATVTAFRVPAEVHAHLHPVDNPGRPGEERSTTFTPTSGEGFKRSSLVPATFKNRQRRGKPRSSRAGGPKSPGWHLAAAFIDRVLWLRRCPPGRIAQQFHRYARQGWTTQQLLEAMDAINRRRGWSSPVTVTRSPWALLAWYLAQIDAVADHPHGGQLVPTGRPGPTDTGKTTHSPAPGWAEATRRRLRSTQARGSRAT